VPRRDAVAVPSAAAPAPGGLVAGDLAVPLHGDTFATTLEHGNLVDNIYWANYFTWPASLLDQLLHAIDPRLVHSAAAGELVVTAISVEHAREAMPLDLVRVELVLRAIFERGAALDVHYFREGAGGARARLAAGRMEVAWMTGDWPRARISTPWPPEVLRHLLQAAKRG
jgi:hypothetical protein